MMPPTESYSVVPLPMVTDPALPPPLALPPTPMVAATDWLDIVALPEMPVPPLPPPPPMDCSRMAWPAKLPPPEIGLAMPLPVVTAPDAK
jgi:hypothetical protein